MKRIFYIAITVLLCNTFTFAQLLKKTIGNYSSELAAKEIKGKSSLTTITWHPNSMQLIVEDNLTSIRYEATADDSTLYKAPIFLKFQCTLPANLNRIFETNPYGTLIRTEGSLTINGITHEAAAYFAPLIVNASNNEILLDFDIKFNLQEFGLDKTIMPLNGLVELEIEDGSIQKYE